MNTRMLPDWYRYLTYDTKNGCIVLFNLLLVYYGNINVVAVVFCFDRQLQFLR